MKGLISFRLEKTLLEELDKISKEEGKTRSVVIKEAIRHYIQRVHQRNNSEPSVPFLEYKRVNDELRDALRRIGMLESRLAELSKENELLRKEIERKKRWWFFR